MHRAVFTGYEKLLGHMRNKSTARMLQQITYLTQTRISNQKIKLTVMRLHLHDGKHLLALPVLPLQPVFKRARVVLPIHCPLLLQADIILRKIGSFFSTACTANMCLSSTLHASNRPATAAAASCFAAYQSVALCTPGLQISFSATAVCISQKDRDSQRVLTH